MNQQHYLEDDIQTQPLVNHNQTTTGDEDETDSLSDLPVEKDPGVKGGRGGVGRDVLVGGLGSDL